MRGQEPRSSSAEPCLLGQKPTTQGDHGPDGLEDAEGPSASQKPVCAAKGARNGEAKSEPVTPRLEGVRDQHRAQREDAEYSQSAHNGREDNRGIDATLNTVPLTLSMISGVCCYRRRSLQPRRATPYPDRNRYPATGRSIASRSLGSLDPVVGTSLSLRAIPLGHHAVSPPTAAKRETVPLDAPDLDGYWSTLDDDAPTFGIDEQRAAVSLHRELAKGRPLTADALLARRICRRIAPTCSSPVQRSDPFCTTTSTAALPDSADSPSCRCTIGSSYPIGNCGPGALGTACSSHKSLQPMPASNRATRNQESSCNCTSPGAMESQTALGADGTGATSNVKIRVTGP